MALLSHELRNPLSPILNSLNILRQMKTEDPILQQAGSIIERQVGQMVRLVDDLLDISRMTKGKLRLRTERVELRVLANLAAESVRPLMDVRRHDFSVSLPTEPIWVEGDPARLEQTLTNLLNNAAKYTEPGGCIWMVVSRAEGEALVRVQDNGLGMTPEMLPRIFELFTQVDSSLGRSQGGLGIGLCAGTHPGGITRGEGTSLQRRPGQRKRVHRPAARAAGHLRTGAARCSRPARQTGGTILADSCRGR